ncbi:MAG: hypothetical protein ACO1O6_11995 [Bacteroidota bacterium]
MKKSLTYSLLVFVTGLLINAAFSQTTYPVVWENLFKATYSSPDLERQTGATGTGSATSVNVSYGLTTTQHVPGNGYFIYTPNDSTQVKKLGFSIMLSAFTASTNMVDYGFSFYSPGQVRAFTADTIVTMSYLNNQEFKVKRDDDSIFFYKAGVEVLRVHADTTENLMLKAELTSAGSDFNNVRVSFSTKRLLDVNPFIDDTANTIEMSIGGGYAPFSYAWEDGETFVYPDTVPNVKQSCDGLHDLTITDSLSVTYDYKFLVGEDVAWTSLNTTQQASDTLSRTSSSNWGSALSSSTIGQNDLFWIQKVADLQQVSRGVGVTYLTSGFTQFSQLEAGFMLLKDNQLQVVFQGSVVFTTKYYEHDVVLLKRKGRLLSWYINGKLIYEFTDVITGSMKMGALLKDTAYMSNVVAYKRNVEPVVQLWDTLRESAGIQVDIDELVTGYGPYHYYLSTGKIPPLNNIYQKLKDSIFDGSLDSLAFFRGDSTQLAQDSINGIKTSQLSLLTEHIFPEVPFGTYYVTVYDSTGLLILSQKTEVLQPLFQYNASNMAQEESLFDITSSSGSTDLEHYISHDNTTDNLDFRVILLRNINQKSYFGYEDYDSSKTVIKYGFEVVESEKKVYFIANGSRISGKVFEVRPNYILSLQKNGTTLRYLINGINRQNQTISGSTSYLLKTRLILKMPIEAKASKNKPFKFEKTVVHSTCSDPTHSATFKISSLASGLTSDAYTYTVTDIVSGTNFLTNEPATIGTTETLTDIPVGVYRVYSYINSNLASSELLTVGVQGEFEQTTNYASSPNSYSLLKNVLSPSAWASALSLNTLKISDEGWVSFTPVNSGSYNKSYLSFESDFSSDFPSGTYALIYTPLNSNIFLFNFYSGGNLLFTRTFVVGLTVTAQIKASTVKFFANSLPISPELDLERPVDIHIKTLTNRKDNGFKDMLFSFSCRQSMYGYAKLSRKLKGEKYKTNGNHIYFSYDEEYADLDENLNFKVYNVENNLVSYLSSYTLDKQHGNNLYKLNVSTLSNGVYVLEVENNKSEIFYLRFIKN